MTFLLNNTKYCQTEVFIEKYEYNDKEKSKNNKVHLIKKRSHKDKN